MCFEIQNLDNFCCVCCGNCIGGIGGIGIGCPLKLNGNWLGNVIGGKGE